MGLCSVPICSSPCWDGWGAIGPSYWIYWSWGPLWPLSKGTWSEEAGITGAKCDIVWWWTARSPLGLWLLLPCTSLGYCRLPCSTTFYVSTSYLRAAAPAADPGRIGKEAKQIGIKTLRCSAPWGFRPFSYVYCCEIYLIGLNFHL